LLDPVSREVRYIGQTTYGKERFAQHLAAAKTSKRKTHSIKWIRSLLSQGLKPEFVLIEVCKSLEELENREIFWIAYYRSLGANLTNHTKGGRSAIGWTYKNTEEKQKANILGHRFQGKQIKELTTGQVFPSIGEAVRILKVKRSRLSKHLNKRTHNCNGYVFRFVNESNEEALLSRESILQQSAELKKQRMRKIQKYKPRPVVELMSNTVYPSLKAAALAFGLDHKQVRYSASNNRTVAGERRFAFL
jgi:hypothetical protein